MLNLQIRQCFFFFFPFFGWFYDQLPNFPSLKEFFGPDTPLPPKSLILFYFLLISRQHQLLSQSRIRASCSLTHFTLFLKLLSHLLIISLIYFSLIITNKLTKYHNKPPPNTTRGTMLYFFNIINAFAFFFFLILVFFNAFGY